MPDTQTEPLLTPDFLARLEQLELVSKKIFLGRMKGERRSKRKGQSVEFADYRNYVIGDDLRFLDWNLFARLDRLFIRLFMEEEDLHFYVLLDIYVIQVVSQAEIDPEIVGDLRLVDIEDDDVAEITVSAPLLKRYKQNLAAYRAAMHEFCTRRGITYLFTNNQVPFDRLVLSYLRQRGLVK